MHSSLKRMWALLGVVAAIGAVAATSAIASHKAGPTIVIWTDANRAASVTKVANAWAAKNGATIQVVTKDFGSIETALGTVAAADAPDVVVAAHDWTGQLAANGLVEPLYPEQGRPQRSSRSTRSTRSRTAPPSRSSTASRCRSRTSACS